MKGSSYQSTVIYLIPGLGADARIFKYLDLAPFDVKCIEWVSPGPAESLASYSKRLLPQIDQRQGVVVVGVSFGGIVAQEIGRQIYCKRVIIISSIKSSRELGKFLTTIKRLNLTRLVSGGILKMMGLYLGDYFFGTTTKEESRMLRAIIEDTDLKFLKWAVDRIMIWQNEKPLENMAHVHGTHDKVFPIKNIHNAIIIDHGGHFMVVSKAQEVRKVLLGQLFV